MAGANLQAIMARARTIIEAITPDVEPGLLFREAPMNGPLAAMAFHGPREGTRRFHVISSVFAGQGGPVFDSLSGVVLQLEDVLTVQVRYHVPLRADGYRRLIDLVSTDCQRIAYALAVSYDAGAPDAACVSRMDPQGSASLEPIISPTVETQAEQSADTWLLTLPFQIKSFVAAT